MPVYEFYCDDCHTIFNFLSRRVNTDKRPVCPKCGRPELERQVSSFAVSRGRTEEQPEGMPEIDEARLEQVLQGLAGEMEGADENDPRQMARVMRRLAEASGLQPGGRFEEAVDRLEAGEDPASVEAELGDLLDGEELFSGGGLRKLKRKFTPPARDDTLYLL